MKYDTVWFFVFLAKGEGKGVLGLFLLEGKQKKRNPRGEDSVLFLSFVQSYDLVDNLHHFCWGDDEWSDREMLHVAGNEV